MTKQTKVEHRVVKAPARGQRISRQPWKSYHEDRPLGTFPTKAEAVAQIIVCPYCNA